MTNNMTTFQHMAELDYGSTDSPGPSSPPATTASYGPSPGSSGSSSGEKRLRTLPPAECLPRHEVLGGYIFVCNNETMEDDLRRQLFGLPARYRDSVRAIQPGLPLFLYNYTTHQLHGVFEVRCQAASFSWPKVS